MSNHPINPELAAAIAKAQGHGNASTVVVAEPKEKIYYNRFPGSKFTCTRNVTHTFLGGQLKTSDPQLIKELDAVSDKEGSPIYTQAGHPVITLDDRLPAIENEQRASQVMQQLAEAQKAMSAR